MRHRKLLTSLSEMLLELGGVENVEPTILITRLAYKLTQLPIKMERYKAEFNRQYHIDNAPNKVTREWLERKFNGEPSPDYSLGELTQLTEGLDEYLKGDLSSLMQMRWIAFKRGYKIKAG